MTVRLSVIIPAYNDADGVVATLDSLARQSLPVGVFEVIVVDNNSTDMTMQAATATAERQPYSLMILSETKRQSSYAARNRGLTAARGAILCFLDAGETVPPNYLATVLTRFDASPKLDYLGCHVRLVPTNETLMTRYNAVRSFPMARYFEQHHFAGTGCLSVRRRVLETVGIFDPRLESSGDMEFGQRVHAAGLTQAFAADLVIDHPARVTFSGLVRKARRIGRGKAQLAWYLPARYQRLRRAHLSPFRLLPGSPLRTRSVAAEKGIDLALADTCAAVGATMVMRLAGMIAFVREYRRLRQLGARAGAPAPLPPLVAEPTEAGAAPDSRRPRGDG